MILERDAVASCRLDQIFATLFCLSLANRDLMEKPVSALTNTDLRRQLTTFVDISLSANSKVSALERDGGCKLGSNHI